GHFLPNMATLLFRDSVPGSAPGSPPGGWQGEPFSLSRFGDGILDSVSAVTINSRIYVEGTDSEGNAFPDGSATVFVGETPNVIAELSVASGALLITSVPTVQVFVLQGGVVSGYDPALPVNAADGD